MAILSSIPVLHCQSIEQTQAFYQQLLRFVVVNKREQNGRLDWVHLMHGATTLMLQQACHHSSGDSNSESSDKTSLKSPIDVTPERGGNQKSKIDLYFFVNNISELHHFIKAKYRNVSELNNTQYQMQEFHLVDPEGNTVILGMTEKD